MTFTKGPKRGLVLQGFFSIERFRGGRAGVNAGGAVQEKRNFWAGKALRPDLMPAGMGGAAVQGKGLPAGGPGRARSGATRRDMLPAAMRGAAVQGKGASASVGASMWPGAPRPALLPGMGRPKLGMVGMVAQRRGAGAGADDVVTSQVPDGRLRLIGAGKPLDAGIREKMEGFFGADFSGVRVHEGPAAQAMGALAFTLGETLYFAPGLYDPTTREGIELLGHELTHVVQQRDGRVSNPYGRGVAIVQDPGLEAEADAMGRKVAEETSELTLRTSRSVAGARRTMKPIAAVRSAGAMQRMLDEPASVYVADEDMIRFKKPYPVVFRGDSRTPNSPDNMFAAGFYPRSYERRPEIRPGKFDMNPTYSVSLTLDLETTALFPYEQHGALVNINVYACELTTCFPLELLYAMVGHPLATYREVVSLGVPHADVIGAITCTRQRTNTGLGGVEATGPNGWTIADKAANLARQGQVDKVSNLPKTFAKTLARPPSSFFETSSITRTSLAEGLPKLMKELRRQFRGPVSYNEYELIRVSLARDQARYKGILTGKKAARKNSY